MERYFIEEGFGNLLIISVYVDDLIYTSDSEYMLEEFKASMMKTFEMTDLGLMKYFLGIEVMQTLHGNFICQKKCAKEILQRFGMEGCQSVMTAIVPRTRLHKDTKEAVVCETNFKQIVGSLMYLTTTRPDLMFGVSLISKYMSKPITLHLQAAKRILRYIKGTIDYGIMYRRYGGGLVGFTDSDYAGDLDDR
ncbi:uncharacterized mitochondrial protein AtMg00810-like [Ricinus communis]|uniref:uncharacterized mitochondrial protein AtMg00810-like n=1 Tax=Ricinus communis TaxID=3988 RepID=UPI0007727B33|nr:uncharacterized mitochondrial protein AtMg00810-like [Ricinus communis]|eukprot:XP_015573326.1 uncharacterized protein LOC107261085 [Ricinus communis]